jgi:ribosomal protein S18 acetylase RimI-like enzyme
VVGDSTGERRKGHTVDSTVAVRGAADEDLANLVEQLGQRFYFTERLSRQRRGRGRLFIAMSGNRAVGDVYVSLEDADESEVRQHLPGVALIQHLEVLAEARNRGVGTTLVTSVESFLLRRGHRRAALGVSPDNADARRLYRRLGYREWEHGIVKTFREEFTADGSMSRTAEQCQILVKWLGDGHH